MPIITSLGSDRRCPAVPARSLLRQVLNAAEDVGADYGDHLLLISVFKCLDKRVGALISCQNNGKGCTLNAKRYALQQRPLFGMW